MQSCVDISFIETVIHGIIIYIIPTHSKKYLFQYSFVSEGEKENCHFAMVHGKQKNIIDACDSAKLQIVWHT